MQPPVCDLGIGATSYVTHQPNTGIISLWWLALVSWRCHVYMKYWYMGLKVINEANPSFSGLTSQVTNHEL